MEYTQEDVMQAIIVALEWGEYGVGIAAQKAAEGGAVYPGGGAALKMSQAAVNLLEMAQTAIDSKSESVGGGEPYFERCTHGVRHYDYTEV